LRREQTLRNDFERGLAELREAHARDNAARESTHELRLNELRQRHEEALQLAREKSFEDLTRERTMLQEENAVIQERIKTLQIELERKSLTDAARIKDLQARLNIAENDQRALSQAAANNEREISSLRTQLAERDRMREIERARIAEESRLAAAAELSSALEENERQRVAAYNEHLTELERALASRKRSLEQSLAERARALDARERRLNEEK
jgi:hypothetical protein